MKATRLLALIALASALTLGAIYGWAAYDTSRKEASEKAWQDVADTTAKIDRAQSLEQIRSETAVARLTYGPVTADEYELCQTHPPSLKRNQVHCAKVIARVKTKIESESNKW